MDKGGVYPKHAGCKKPNIGGHNSKQLPSDLIRHGDRHFCQSGRAPPPTVNQIFIFMFGDLGRWGVCPPLGGGQTELVPPGGGVSFIFLSRSAEKNCGPKIDPKSGPPPPRGEGGGHPHLHSGAVTAVWPGAKRWTESFLPPKNRPEMPLWEFFGANKML